MSRIRAQPRSGGSPERRRRAEESTRRRRAAPASAPRTAAPSATGRVGAGGADETTRTRILATALRVFAERGFDGARTREIADRAGANLGLITYYFGNKEGLWREAVASAFGELERELAEAMTATTDGDERRQLERVARRFVRFVARKPEFMRLMNDEGKHDNARMRWLADRFVKPLHEALGQLVARAQARGLVPDIPAASLHYIMLGAAGLLFSQAPECRRVTGVDPMTDAFADAHADAVIRLLVTPPAGA